MGQKYTSISDLYKQVKLNESEIIERKLTSQELEDREKIAKKLPMDDFKKRYGKDAMAVKMATATNIVKKKSQNETIEDELGERTGKYSKMNLDKAKKLMGPSKNREQGVKMVMKGLGTTYKHANQLVDKILGVNPKTGKIESAELDEGKKRYNTTSNVGKAKYVINFHDGKKTNKDGSDFFDIKIFKNKPDFENAEKELKSKGYVKEEVELEEKYDLYHKSFSDAMQHAYDYAQKKLGITVDKSEIDRKVATGPRKPSEGKTNKYRLKGKGGNLQIQVYNKGGSKPFELNMYKEEVELDEKLDKEDEPKVKEIIKKLKGASQAHAGQAKDLQKAVTEKDELDEAEAYSPKQIKMAIGIASDPRYKGGNYSGAVKAIEKIKGGLSQHKQVAAVLKRQNEALGENLDGRTREYRQHRERLESLRSKRLEARHIDPADIDTSATDDDIKSADKNIMMQLRKSVSLRGQYSVEFLDKKKVKVPQKIALAVIAKYNSLKKPMDKEKFQAKVAKSHRDLLMGLKENLDEKKKKDKIKIGEESTLDRMNKKLQEKKNG